jgi:hypothetical protein
VFVLSRLLKKCVGRGLDIANGGEFERGSWIVIRDELRSELGSGRCECNAGGRVSPKSLYVS